MYKNLTKNKNVNVFQMPILTVFPKQFFLFVITFDKQLKNLPKLLNVFEKLFWKMRMEKFYFFFFYICHN